MTRMTMKTAGALTAVALTFTACSSASGPKDFSIWGQLAQTAAPAAAHITGRGKPAQEPKAALSADEMAARALAANPAPLILVGLESSGAVQVMAMTGENGNMRTYMTPNEQAVILRSGMLSGTRGLGHDLSVAEMAESAALIRARRSGQATRVMRYLAGDGVERPLQMRCEISSGATQSFTFAGRGWNALQMVESCRAGAVEVQNNYLVTADGQIPVSRQWIGPALGYVTVQTIRP